MAKVLDDMQLGTLTDKLTLPVPLSKRIARVKLSDIDKPWEEWGTDPTIDEEFLRCVRAGTALGMITVADMSDVPGWNGPRYYILDGIHRARAYDTEGIAELDVEIYTYATVVEVLTARLNACARKSDDVTYTRALRGIVHLFSARLAGLTSEIHLLEPVFVESGVWRAVPRAGGTPVDLNQLAFAFDAHVFVLQQTGQTIAATWEHTLDKAMEEVAAAVGKDRKWLRATLARYTMLPNEGLRQDREKGIPVLTRIPDGHIRRVVRDRWLREKAPISDLWNALGYLGIVKRGGNDNASYSPDAWVPTRKREWVLSQLNQHTLSELAVSWVHGHNEHFKRESARTAQVTGDEAPTPTINTDAIFGVATPLAASPAAASSVSSRFEQRLQRDMQDPEFAAGYHEQDEVTRLRAVLGAILADAEVYGWESDSIEQARTLLTIGYSRR